MQYNFILIKEWFCENRLCKLKLRQEKLKINPNGFLQCFKIFKQSDLQTLQNKILMADTKNIESLVNLLAKTSGRDKILRTIQYFFRFLYQLQKDKTTYIAVKPLKQQIINTAVKLENVVRTTMITRKILRFGKLIDGWMTIKDGIDNIKNGNVQNIPKQVIRLLAEFSLCLFFFFDHIQFLQYVGWLRNEKLNRIGYLSDLSWLFECIFTLIYLKLQYSDTKNLNVSFGEKRRIRNKIKIQAVKNIFDMGLLYGFLRPGGLIGNKVIGVLGTLSSLIGVYQVWQ